MKRSYTYLKGLLTLALAAFTGWMWAGVTSSFGVNFRTAEAQDIPADTAVGFTKSDYAQPTTWANLNGGNGKQDITVGGATLNVTWYSRGTYNSGADTSTLDGKLLYNYLDDTVNNGRQKAAVKITGLPADKQYAVALILSGDANNDGFNGKYSPVWINGETYSYVDGALVTGDAAVAATTWGNRRAANNNGPTTFIEGTNVMFVEGVTGSELIITSAMDNQNVSRLTIAGVQVWVTDTTVTAPAVTAPTDSDVISVNFHSGDGAAADGDGLVAAKHWHNTTGENGTIDSLTVVNGDDSVASSGTLTYKSKNTWGYGTNVTTNFLKGYLDDGAHDDVVGATITATVPFENYSVIVYMATDTAGQFKPVIVNGTLYAGSTTLSSVGYAAAKPSMMQNTSVCNWGTCQTATAAYGVNTLRVDGLSGNLTIQAGNDQTYNGIRNRGGIAAIQIVNTGDSILSDVQEIDWTDQPADQLKVSELPTLEKSIVELTLADGAVLIVDEIKEGKLLNIISTGAVTIKVTNLNISQAQLNAMLNTDGVTGTVTNNYVETNGYTVGDVTYPLVYLGGSDGWETSANWATGTRTNGETTQWIAYTGTVVPGAPNSNLWNIGLIDGDLIGDKITADEDGYKVVNTPALEGWAFKITVANGVHVKVPSLKKLQGGCIIRVDDSSKVTVTDKANPGDSSAANEYYIDAENGLEFVNMSMPAGTAYLGVKGSIKVGTFDTSDGPQTIGGVTLDLGDSTLTGRKVVTRTLYTYTSGTTFSIAENAVTTSVEGVTAEAAEILQTVGQYKFETKSDGYCVSYVAYAEDDEIGAMNTWTKGEDALWATAGNWSSGFVPAEGATATISITADTTITIPAEGVTVGTLLVSGDGTLTIAGGKITATKILAEANIAADETTLALAEMDIAEGKTVAYTTTTTIVDADNVNNVNHALSLKAMTGAGTFVKKGTGVIGLFATAAEPAIVVEEGAIYVREAPTTAMNIAAKAGAEIRLAAWHVDFANTANKITLDGGAQLTLANGANVSGTITIANAAETAAKICGSSFNDSTIAAAITGAGKVEFADGGSFGDATKYPCDGATTYSGLISGDLQVIISDTSAVTFTANNTYTGGTVIAEGTTVSVSNLNTIFGTGNVTGAGTVKIAGGTYNGLSLAQYTDANTTIVIPADNTVTGYFNNATWTCAAKIQLDGTLSLTNGFGAGKYTFTGPWTGAGSFSLSHNNPADVVRITGDISGFTGNISVAGARAITFCAESTAFNQKYSGKICVHGDYAYTAKVNGTWSAPVVVENGAKIGGEGSIDNTLTFNAGSIIDGAVTATGDVTLNGAVTVSGEAGATVLTCANAESLDLTKFTAPEGLKCVAEDGAVKLAVAMVTVTIPAAPANTKWYYNDAEVSGSISVDPNTNVTLTLKADEGYVFADGTTEREVTVNVGETGATVEKPDVTAATPVAQVGETKYQTLADAIAAGSEVTVIADIVTDGPITINKTVKINLNNQTITATNDESGDGVFHVVAGGDLTLDGEGTVNALGPNDYCMAVWADGGKVTIKGGTYTNVGATSAEDGAHFDLIYVKNGGSAIINGGTFICETPRWTLNSHNTLKGTISITGGKFYALNPADIDTDDGVTTWCADGYTAVAGEGEDEDYYVVTEIPETAVAMIGDTYYATLAEAIEAATAGQTITLVKDITASEIITIEMAITLDGNGKTLTSTAGRAINVDCAGAVTIKDLTINAGERAINIINQAATVTIDGVTATAKNVAVMIATTAGAATVSIDDSNLTGLMVVGVYGAGADVTIDGSTITNVDANETENYGAITVGDTADKATVTVTNTSITVADDSKKAYNFSSTATITGVDEVGKVAAMIGDAGFDTIEEAIEYAKAGDTIKLLAPVTITTDTTIDLAGKNITSDGDVFIVTGGTLTITGEGTITANTDNAGTACALWANGGNAVINGGTWSCGGDTETTDVAHQNDTIYTKNGGKVTITGGTFEYTENVWTLNENDNNRGTISIKGGKFKKFNPANNTIEGTGTNFCAAGYTAVAEGEDYTVKAIVIHEELVDSPAAEAIKEVMAEAGVAEITDYSIITTGSGTPADVADVAAVLEVFEVTPTVDANGVLSVAYEFGISEMTNAGDTITITAGVTGAEYRADVTVAFYADGAEIGTATTTADSTTVSITGISATAIDGKKITVKAIKQ